MPPPDSDLMPQNEHPNRDGWSGSRSPRREKDEQTRGRASAQFDVILPIQEPYMQQIVSGEKSYEFRKYCLKRSVERVWFYRTAPHSSIEYICEILPARTRNPGDLALEEDGLGNNEFNTKHKDWEGYDFAYKILSVYQIDKPITLEDLRNVHGLKSAPRGRVYVPLSILEVVDWQSQSRLR